MAKRTHAAAHPDRSLTPADPIRCHLCRNVERASPELLDSWGWTWDRETGAWECPAHVPAAPAAESPAVLLAAALDLGANTLAELRRSIPPGKPEPPVWRSLFGRFSEVVDGLAAVRAKLAPGE